MGIDTGVDLDKLIEAVWIAEELVGHPLWGHVSKGGPRPTGKKLYSMDMPFVETLGHARHFIPGRRSLPRRAVAVERNDHEPAAAGDPQRRCAAG